MKESEIQRAIMEYLDARGLFFWRNYMGAAMYTAKSGEMRFRKNPNKGMPDLMLVFCGILVGIEVKAKTKQSQEQFEWQKKFELNGAVYILARSVDDVKEALDGLRLEEPHMGAS